MLSYELCFYFITIINLELQNYNRQNYILYMHSNQHRKVCKVKGVRNNNSEA